jgi:hypothetical protein
MGTRSLRAQQFLICDDAAWDSRERTVRNHVSSMFSEKRERENAACGPASARQRVRHARRPARLPGHLPDRHPASRVCRSTSSPTRRTCAAEEHGQVGGVDQSCTASAPASAWTTLAAAGRRRPPGLRRRHSRQGIRQSARTGRADCRASPSARRQSAPLFAPCPLPRRSEQISIPQEDGRELRAIQ